MSTNKNGVFSELYQLLFSKHWPVWVGAILAGFLNVVLFTISGPWSGSAGYSATGKSLYKALGMFSYENAGFFLDNKWAIISIMIIVGSFTGALLSKNFAIRIPPVGEIIKGFIGGSLMAVGATIGVGCTIGGFFSGLPALSGGAIFLTIGFFIGTILAVKYLLWEMERFPGISSGKSMTFLGASEKTGNWQKWVGVLVILATIALAYYFFTNGENILGWFAVIGALLGLISQRSIFCIVRAFREPFLSGESSGAKGIIAGIFVVLIGFVAIKTMNIGIGDTLLRSREMAAVHPNFWVPGLLGGTIFGLGMVIAGGCAVGTLWRMGEGQIKLWFSALGFILISPISSTFIVPFVRNIIPFEGQFKNYLPDYLGYGGAVLLVVAILILWYWFAVWNEKNDKFNAF